MIKTSIHFLVHRISTSSNRTVVINRTNFSPAKAITHIPVDPRHVSNAKSKSIKGNNSVPQSHSIMLARDVIRS